jgi:putative heme degradation protein
MVTPMGQSDFVTQDAMKLEERVEELMVQLDELGYTVSQQKAIIQETVGNVPLKSLTEEQGVCLVAALDEYVRFGLKCHLIVTDN